MCCPWINAARIITSSVPMFCRTEHGFITSFLAQIFDSCIELLLAAASCICAICGCSRDRCNYSFFKPVVKMPTDEVLKRREVRQGSTKAGTSQRQGFDEWHDQKATGWTFLLEMSVNDAKGWKTMQDHVFQKIVNGMCYEQFGQLQLSSKIFGSLFYISGVEVSATHQQHRASVC